MDCDCGTQWDGFGVCETYKNSKEVLSIGVVGSRDFFDAERLYKELDELINSLNDHYRIHIISGGAGGADSLGIEYAMNRGYSYTIHEAKWDDLSHPDARIKVNRYGAQYDANAGFRRNTQIVEESDVICAFHNGSPGTRDTLTKARRLNKKIYEYKF